MKTTTCASSSSSATCFDVVICGAGLAGLTLARQLRRELPEAKVTILETQRRPLPDACFKVGESTVELAAHYFDRLGLWDYMRERQLLKWGIRFYPGGGDLPLHLRTEIGPIAEPPLKTYQVDRGRLETDLREMVEKDGVTLIEGANDRDEDADRLADFARGLDVRVNLIPLNPGPDPALRAPSMEACRAFQKRLLDAGVRTLLRLPHGHSVGAACGQLAGARRAAETAAESRS